MAMNIERKKDLSIYYWLTNLFSTAPFVKIEDGFPVSDLQVPCVSVESQQLVLNPLELGNHHGYRRVLYRIDVFAENKSQRDEMGYRILDNIEDVIPVYDYDEGFPPSVSPTQIGVLLTDDIKMQIIRVNPNLVSKLYWRAAVTFTALYQTII